MKDEKQQLYSDHYFEKGHLLLKIWQTFIAILGWLGVIVPIVVTVTAYWAQFNPKIPHLWSNHTGIFQIEFVGAILIFAFAMATLFSVSMTIIQNRRRERIAERWPTFNPINQKKREHILNEFMEARFGDEKFRQEVRYYEVEPEQNIKPHEIKELYRKSDLDDIYKE